MNLDEILELLEDKYPTDVDNYTELVVFTDESGQVRHAYWWHEDEESIASFEFESLEELEDWLREDV